MAMSSFSGLRSRHYSLHLKRQRLPKRAKKNQRKEKKTHLTLRLALAPPVPLLLLRAAATDAAFGKQATC